MDEIDALYALYVMYVICVGMTEKLLRNEARQRHGMTTMSLPYI